MEKIKPFMIYPTEKQLDKFKKASKMESRAISNFVVKMAEEASDLIMETEKNEE